MALRADHAREDPCPIGLARNEIDHAVARPDAGEFYHFSGLAPFVVTGLIGTGVGKRGG